MNYTVTTESYNDRRYGKPWLAEVTTHLTKDFAFIDWDGTPGHAGEHRFEAEPGTLLAAGQKDHRKGRGGVDGYKMCWPDGGVRSLPEDAARKLLKVADLNQRWQQRAAERIEEIAEERNRMVRDVSGRSRAYYSYEFQKIASAWEYIESYVVMLQRAGVFVENPLAARTARDLGLVAEPAPVACPAVGMEAFF